MGVLIKIKEMRKTLFALLGLITFTLSGVARAEAELEDGVLVLTDDNFDEEIAKYDYLLVEFYAPWCGHCKKLTPEYAAAAQHLATQDPPRFVAKVDATEHKAVAERFGVKGFPTLHWFVKGERQDYTGGREKDTIVSWIMKKTGPPSTEIACDNIAAKVDESNRVAVFFGAFEGANFDAFVSVAQVEERFQFFHSNDEACRTKLGVSENGLAVFRNFDEETSVYSGEFAAPAIREFLSTKAVARFISFNEEAIEPIFQQRNPAVVLFTEEESSPALDVFKQASTQLEGKILFVKSGVSDGIQSRLGEFLGVTKDDLPTIRIVEPAEELKKFVYTGDAASISIADLEAFIGEWKDGKLAPHLKSEEIPENNDGPLTVLVGKNFHDIVNDSTKDVLVKYYAPWCGHCKKLAPIWDELAESVKDVSDLVIAKFDATVNEVAGLEIRGYPSLKFYPKDNKAGVDYDGERELPDFKNWLSENSGAYKAANVQTDAAEGHDEL